MAKPEISAGQIKDGTITDADIAANAAISASKLDSSLATKAYVDAAATGGGAEYPWIVEINPMYASYADTNFHDIYLSNDATAPQVMGSASGTGARFPLNAGLFNSGAQNDEVSFYVTLGAGTWSFRMLSGTFSNAGIVTVSLGGSSIGTLDQYSSTNYAGVKGEITGVSVATSGKKTLNLKMASKNGSSSGYYAIIHYIWLVRTA